MPAPLPVRVRYNDTGALSLAAAAVGAGLFRQDQANARLASRSRPTTSFRPSSRPSRPFGDVAQPDPNITLQPPPARIIRGVSDAAFERGKLARGAGLGASETSALNLAVNIGDTETANRILRDQLQRPGLSFQGVGAEDSQVDPTTTAKETFLSSIAQSTNLPPQEVEALTALVDDPNTSLAQLRIAASQAASRVRQQTGTLSPRETATRSASDQSSLRRQRQNRLDSLRDRLIQKGIDPSVGPVETPGQNNFDFGTGFRDVAPQPPSLEDTLLFEEFQRLQNMVEQVRPTPAPNSSITTAGNQTSTTPQQGGFSIRRIR